MYLYLLYLKSELCEFKLDIFSSFKSQDDLQRGWTKMLHLHLNRKCVEGRTTQIHHHIIIQCPVLFLKPNDEEPAGKASGCEICLPLVTLPFLTFPYLSLPFLTFPYLSLPFIAFPYLSLSYLTFSYLSLHQKPKNSIYLSLCPHKTLMR